MSERFSRAAEAQIFQPQIDEAQKYARKERVDDFEAALLPPDTTQELRSRLPFPHIGFGSLGLGALASSLTVVGLSVWAASGISPVTATPKDRPTLPLTAHLTEDTQTTVYIGTGCDGGEPAVTIKPGYIPAGLDEVALTLQIPGGKRTPVELLPRDKRTLPSEADEIGVVPLPEQPVKSYTKAVDFRGHDHGTEGFPLKAGDEVTVGLQSVLTDDSDSGSMKYALGKPHAFVTLSPLPNCDPKTS